MTDQELLAMVKADLQMATDIMDTYLGQLILSAKAAIKREGITLEDTIPDGHLVVMYASYLYRKRAEDEAKMPRMLRYALNNRLFSEKGEKDVT